MSKLTHYVLGASMLVLGAFDAHATPPATPQHAQRIDVFGVQFCMGETPNDASATGAKRAIDNTKRGDS